MNNGIVNHEAEQFVLGSILKKAELLSECKLKVEDFYSAGHQVLYEAMLEMQENEWPIEPMSIVQHLGERITDVGGVSYLMKLGAAVPSLRTFDFYIERVREASLRRTAVKTLRELLNESEAAENAEQLIATIQESASVLLKEIAPEKTFRPIGEILTDHEDMLIERQSKKGLTGVKTASSVLDKLTGGYQNQDLIIIAARPSVGKTAFMLNDAREAAKSGTVDAVGIISLEMPDLPVSERVLAAEGNIDGMKLRTGFLEDYDWSKYTMSRDMIATLPIYIDDSPGATIQDIRAKVQAFKKKHGRIIIYIDYLQLIKGGKRFANKTEEVGYISGQLKQIARENDCPIVVISSLSRNVEQRQDKRPMMSDLRESGQIEFDADQIMFLYRDDYYDAETEKKNIVEINVAKGRNTGTGMFEMLYLKNYSKFVDLGTMGQGAG
ncbi:replicative DNA helicase [Paenibacillus dendritiformis]|uniref:replicative DNA helicase n=1 Tax=Paenibacillus dendritiformis TaxID=130049 RepID=UPI001B14D0BB|nr:replicative DNA helicase [Paenibacillus dendritiformis]GIO73902.1 replicative DNA helicase [Paenibacillus dendritiformis]